MVDGKKKRFGVSSRRYSRFDVAAIKESLDCRDWVSADLHQAPAYVRPRYSLFICPFHQDTHPSMSVMKYSFYCFACGEKGDIIKWVQKTNDLSFVDACKRLGGESLVIELDRVERNRFASGHPLPVKSSLPPSARWQEAADVVAKAAEDRLFNSKAGERHLKYLIEKRGLQRDVIEMAHIGCISRASNEDKAFWDGLAHDMQLKLDYIHEGLAFPWYSSLDGVSPTLWGIKVRRTEVADKRKRYTQITSSDEAWSEAFRPNLSGGLYWADHLDSDLPGLVIEGEINCLTVFQEAGKIICPVSQGPATESIDERWLLVMAQQRDWLAFFDPDVAGAKAVVRTRQVLGDSVFFTHLPDNLDVNDYMMKTKQAGMKGEIMRWVSEMLEHYHRVTSSEPELVE